MRNRIRNAVAAVGLTAALGVAVVGLSGCSEPVAKAPAPTVVSLSTEELAAQKQTRLLAARAQANRNRFLKAPRETVDILGNPVERAVIEMTERHTQYGLIQVAIDAYAAIHGIAPSEVDIHDPAIRKEFYATWGEIVRTNSGLAENENMYNIELGAPCYISVSLVDQIGR